jgi:hypothetical protein
MRQSDFRCVLWGVDDALEVSELVELLSMISGSVSVWKCSSPPAVSGGRHPTQIQHQKCDSQSINPKSPSTQVQYDLPPSISVGFPPVSLEDRTQYCDSPSNFAIRANPHWFLPRKLS